MDQLTESDGKILINMARNSINGYKTTDQEIPEKLKTKRGAFVTINEHNSLRGCIGYLRPVMPLNVAVEKAAWNAAFRDPRFEPLKKGEYAEITVEVTVIGELLKAKYEELINEKPGKYGIYLENGIYSGTLLPQVALEYNMNMKEFIQETCKKAGMEKDCYKNSEIYAYEARVFSEKHKD
ncbi:AmmeMemoRadiSam system protein A [Ferroplasma sp.]|uniref:AmmeMemoRadiSam system protein A n=1 Tax=Ferroplasma sp. TaxID=2591003 RepID=UPI00307D281C